MKDCNLLCLLCVSYILLTHTQQWWSQWVRFSRRSLPSVAHMMLVVHCTRPYSGSFFEFQTKNLVKLFHDTFLWKNVNLLLHFDEIFFQLIFNESEISWKLPLCVHYNSGYSTNLSRPIWSWKKVVFSCCLMLPNVCSATYSALIVTKYYNWTHIWTPFLIFLWTNLFEIFCISSVQ